MDLQDFFVSWSINTLLTFLQIGVKNPAKKEQLKRAMLKVRNAIDTAYAGEPEFS